MVVQPRLSAAVMLLRDSTSEQGGIEVFMVRRVVQSEFMPDVYVFPSGSVSSDDQQTEASADLCAPVAATAADPGGLTALGQGVRAAAIRELFEEANVLLAYREGTMLAINADTVLRFADYRRAFNERSGSLKTLATNEHLTLATDHLAYFAHWITPESLPKRYDTHFFLAIAPAEQEAAYDNLETSEGVWIGPQVALERFQRKEFPIAFPTFHQLHDLSAFATAQEALIATTTRPVAISMPVALRNQDGTLQLSLPGEEPSVWSQIMRDK